MFFRQIQWLINKLELLRDKFIANSKQDATFELLRNNLTHAHNKATKYFRLCDDAPMYYAAVALDPSYKNNFFR